MNKEMGIPRPPDPSPQIKNVDKSLQYVLQLEKAKKIKTYPPIIIIFPLPSLA